MTQAFDACSIPFHVRLLVPDGLRSYVMQLNGAKRTPRAWWIQTCSHKMTRAMYDYVQAYLISSLADQPSCIYASTWPCWWSVKKVYSVNVKAIKNSSWMKSRSTIWVTIGFVDCRFIGNTFLSSERSLIVAFWLICQWLRLSANEIAERIGTYGIADRPVTGPRLMAHAHEWRHVLGGINTCGDE